MRTTKTDKILSLVNGDKPEGALPESELQPQPSNPLIRVPEGEEVPVIFTKDTPGFQLVNVIFLLINEQLGQTMERFNCCMCPKCIAAVTSEVLKRVPPVVISVRRKSDADKVNRLAAEYRSDVTKLLAKAVINTKTSIQHKNS